MNLAFLTTLAYGTRLVRNDGIRGTYLKGSSLTSNRIAMDNGEQVRDLSDLSDYRTLAEATAGFFKPGKSERTIIVGMKLRVQDSKLRADKRFAKSILLATVTEATNNNAFYKVTEIESATNYYRNTDIPMTGGFRLDDGQMPASLADEIEIL